MSILAQRKLFVPIGAALAAFAVAALPAVPATAASVGYVRLAHLSPDTPAVDVYFSSQTGAVAEKVFPGVGYGVLSDYMSVPTGNYAVAMREAGAAKSVAPVLTTQVTVASGKAYTVAGVGRYADLGLRVLDDDLTPPPADKAKVRVVQASVRAPVLDVGVAGGRTIAQSVAFATTTGYQQVDPGRWTLRVQPTGGSDGNDLPCTLGGGNVYSLLVLDGTDGQLTAELRQDAGRQGPAPQGGVETGAGGASRTRLPLAVPVLALLGAALLVTGLLLVTGGRLVPGGRPVPSEQPVSGGPPASGGPPRRGPAG
ncbi:MAG TPA: DUF4397 domain-containing protein [Pilimelia sp.]|nr:DUF4397 domain-containing protein [Pilimelia sp.]